MTAPFWTRERLEQLCVIVNDGCSLDYAGERLGTTGAAAKTASLKYLRREGARYVIEREAAPRIYRPRPPKAVQPKPVQQPDQARRVAFTFKPIYAPFARPILTGAPEQEPRGCRFIFGELNQPGWRYCQKPTAGLSSWCPACRHVVLSGVTAPRYVTPDGTAPRVKPCGRGR